MLQKKKLQNRVAKGKKILKKTTPHSGVFLPKGEERERSI